VRAYVCVRVCMRVGECARACAYGHAVVRAGVCVCERGLLMRRTELCCCSFPSRSCGSYQPLPAPSPGADPGLRYAPPTHSHHQMPRPIAVRRAPCAPCAPVPLDTHPRTRTPSHHALAAPTPCLQCHHRRKRPQLAKSFVFIIIPSLQCSSSAACSCAVAASSC